MQGTDDDMFGDRHDIRARNFSDSNFFLVCAVKKCQRQATSLSDHSRVEINVVRTDTSGHGQLEVFGLFDDGGSCIP